jgi:hypothetical protein
MIKGPARKLFEYLCADFEKAWDSMAASELAPEIGGIARAHQHTPHPRPKATDP